MLDLEQARALRENPELIQLRELKTLTHMAKAGGRFAIGLRTPRASAMLQDAESEG